MTGKADDALAAALRLLTSRGRSHHELGKQLARRGFSPDECAGVLEKVAALGYLDDRALALARATSLLRDRGQGPAAVRARLRLQGFGEEDLRVALETATAELGYDPLASARALLKKRRLEGALSPKERARAARLLQGRGFEEGLIEALLPGSGVLDSSGHDD